MLKDELEEKMKKVKEENDLLKDELNQSIIERNACVKEKLICNVSCSINDLTVLRFFVIKNMKMWHQILSFVIIRMLDGI